VDVFVAPVSNERFGFLPFMEVYRTIRKAIGEERDLGYSACEGLDGYICAEAEGQAVRLF
jgi:hypothetical protein